LAYHDTQQRGQDQKEHEIQHGRHDEKHAARVPLHAREIKNIIADGLPPEQRRWGYERIGAPDEDRLQGCPQRDSLPDGTSQKLVTEAPSQHAHGEQSDEDGKAAQTSGPGKNQPDLREYLTRVYIVAITKDLPRYRNNYKGGKKVCDEITAHREEHEKKSRMCPDTSEAANFINGKLAQNANCSRTSLDLRGGNAN
jgi:hypothetical protein